MPTILRKISVLVYQKNQTICKLKSNHVFFYKYLILLVFLTLLSCCRTKTEEIDLSSYFAGLNGTAVFYNANTGQSKIYNKTLSYKQSSPCSTFKIMSSYIGLSEHKISMQDSLRKWNRKTYWNPQWNRDITFPQAFQASCVWYYRRLIDEVGEKRTKHYLQKFNYGNMDTSDWKGLLNSNTNIPELRGFWLESSLKISPVEQTRVLAEIFKKNSPAAADLQNVMKIQDSPVKIYGKTGMGIKNDKVVDAWFVGFYETADNKIFFAVRLDDNDNNAAPGYRTRASQIARQIAVEIINSEKIF